MQCSASKRSVPQVTSKTKASGFFIWSKKKLAVRIAIVIEACTKPFPWQKTGWLTENFVFLGMLSSVEQAFVGRDEKRAPLKTPAWEATKWPVGSDCDVTRARPLSRDLIQKFAFLLNKAHFGSKYLVSLWYLCKCKNIEAWSFRFHQNFRSENEASVPPLQART